MITFKYDIFNFYFKPNNDYDQLTRVYGIWQIVKRRLHNNNLEIKYNNT